MVAHLADAPLGHLANDADGLTIEALIARAANDADVAHLTVGADDETAQHAALNALFLGIRGILARLVDEVDKASLATRELGLNVHVVKLIDFHVRLLCCGIDRRDMTHLRYHG